MSLLSKSIVQAFAESVAVGEVTAEAADALAPHLEVRLREIIQDASKFMRHSKRHTLSTEDINSALISNLKEPIYGYGSKVPAGFSTAQGLRDTFFVQDPLCDINEILAQPLPKCPVEVGTLPHWLVIEGKQPTTAENAVIERRKPAAKRTRAAANLDNTSADAAAAAPASASGRGNETEERAAPVKNVVKHVLSQELLLYLERVTGLLRGDGVGGQHLEVGLLTSLALDPGLTPLLPYLTQLIGEEVQKALKSLRQLRLLLKVVRALLQNVHMALESHLHQLIPVTLTCLVAKNLGGSPAEDHWSLRDAAAALVGLVIARFGSDYPDVQTRISRQLLKAFLDPARPLATHYGAVRGLAAMGPRVVQLLLVPHMPAYSGLLDKALSTGRPSSVRRLEAERVESALLFAFRLSWTDTSMAQAVRSYGEAGMRFKVHAPKQPLRNGASGKSKRESDAAPDQGTEEPAATTRLQGDGAEGGSEGDKDNGEASSQQGQVASAQAASQGGQTTVPASAGAVQANEAMGDGKSMQATQEILKQSETSAAALMAAYCTFGDRALPFVPFSPLFEMCL
ncbi:Transcription initiation factor TFIID subunit 6 [Coccomyxa sp. Obi]|nr:Transcription initiation factor TFIID subunit 6 [Coccomyxa sp. Obi]